MVSEQASLEWTQWCDVHMLFWPPGGLHTMHKRKSGLLKFKGQALIWDPFMLILCAREL